MIFKYLTLIFASHPTHEISELCSTSRKHTIIGSTRWITIAGVYHLRTSLWESSSLLLWHWGYKSASQTERRLFTKEFEMSFSADNKNVLLLIPHFTNMTAKTYLLYKPRTDNWELTNSHWCTNYSIFLMTVALPCPWTLSHWMARYTSY